MRKHTFVIGEYYHIYNRGTDKREIIKDKEDLDRFVQSMIMFNRLETIGSIYEQSFKKQLGSSTSKLVEIICYCINPNHFHILVSPLIENGIEKFMQRLGGYTKYFNEKYERTGSLFQGRFKSKHIDDDLYLMHVSSYINMNNRDLNGEPIHILSCSTLEQFIMPNNKYPLKCDTGIILSHFSKGENYLDFAKKSWFLTSELKKILNKDKDFEFLPSGIGR